jgi:hypothetical protein
MIKTSELPDVATVRVDSAGTLWAFQHGAWTYLTETGWVATDPPPGDQFVPLDAAATRWVTKHLTDGTQ